LSEGGCKLSGKVARRNSQHSNLLISDSTGLVAWLLYNPFI
jgi:hypothetical protein